VLDAGTRAQVWSGVLLPARRWKPSGETVRLADFSALRTAGEYVVRVLGQTSYRFTIDAGVYDELVAVSLKSFYFNRAGQTLEERHAGPWARAMGHPDERILFHPSAQDERRDANAAVASPKGWYDAGDFNKYVVNSGIATYTLLAAYEHFPKAFNQLQLNIPESGGVLPDILDEVLWNLDWLETMQDGADGGVYHKLTTLEFAPVIMPDQAREPRYMVAKSTDAALNFAAVMAAAARIFQPFDDGNAQRYREAAIRAWRWARQNPNRRYAQPADVSTGTYTRPGLSDEWVWAGAELFLLTGEADYLQPWEDSPSELSTPDWSDVGTLGWVSMANHLDQLSDFQSARVRDAISQYAVTLQSGQRQSAYGITYGSHARDFQWGGNSVALNQALLAVQAYRLDQKPALLALAQGNLNYVLGQNALGLSFVTGIGSNTPQNIHHRASAADGVAEPVPGLLAGGPNTNGKDQCQYPSVQPALAYLDDFCSYTTNEIAINWTAPLVYVSAAIQSLN
ncbi:MAG: glycoside hydrolase family 9 protein, partial [Lysobacterales bacterium]